MVSKLDFDGNFGKIDEEKGFRDDIFCESINSFCVLWEFGEFE